jgi:type IV pilus assembly protein PilA
MVVVAMIGVLAALAVVGYRQWIDWSMTAESKSLVQMLSNAQEAYYAQTKGYLNCSADWTVNELYPRTPSDHKQTLHDPGHANYPCWKALQVDTTDPTYMSFWVRAGDTAAFPPLPSTAPFDMKLTNIGMPPEANRPWYIIIAVGDVDGDQHYNFFMSHSAQPSLVYSEDEN